MTSLCSLCGAPVAPHVSEEGTHSAESILTVEKVITIGTALRIAIGALYVVEGTNPGALTPRRSLQEALEVVRELEAAYR